MRVKNVNIFMDIKKVKLKRRGFRGGSDEKMRRMWLGLEIVVAGLPPLVLQFHEKKSFINFFVLFLADKFTTM